MVWALGWREQGGAETAEQSIEPYPDQQLKRLRILLTLQRLIFEVSRRTFPDAAVRVDLCDSLFTAFRRVELLPALAPGLGAPIEEAADKEATLAAYRAPPLPAVPVA